MQARASRPSIGFSAPVLPRRRAKKPYRASVSSGPWVILGSRMVAGASRFALLQHMTAKTAHDRPNGQ